MPLKKKQKFFKQLWQKKNRSSQFLSNQKVKINQKQIKITSFLPYKSYYVFVNTIRNLLVFIYFLSQILQKIVLERKGEEVNIKLIFEIIVKANLFLTKKHFNNPENLFSRFGYQFMNSILNATNYWLDSHQNHQSLKFNKKYMSICQMIDNIKLNGSYCSLLKMIKNISTKNLAADNCLDTNINY